MLTNNSKYEVKNKIIKLLSRNNTPSNSFRNLYSFGLLPSVFPELEETIGVIQNKYHQEDVWNHLLRSLDASVFLTEDPLLRLATLTHDIGKPRTKTIDKLGNIHFYKHEVIGAKMMRYWMRKHKFSEKEINYVSKLVLYHQFRFYNNTSDKTLKKWLRNVGPFWKDLLLLRQADRKGNLKLQGKPSITHEMKILNNRVNKILLEKIPIFYEDLSINRLDIKKLGIYNRKIQEQALSELLGKSQEDPSRNNKKWLIEHIKKVYINDRTNRNRAS